MINSRFWTKLYTLYLPKFYLHIIYRNTFNLKDSLPVHSCLEWPSCCPSVIIMTYSVGHWLQWSDSTGMHLGLSDLRLKGYYNLSSNISLPYVSIFFLCKSTGKYFKSKFMLIWIFLFIHMVMYVHRKRLWHTVWKQSSKHCFF